ncbi:MAG TPA: hypothetical protein DCW31_06990 [Lactobacillus sp.]|nr:hypothetical protein [Lactobacillus sp.]
MADGFTTFLTANAGHGRRFLLSSVDEKEIGRVKTKGWSNLWNQFFGWLVAVPIHDEMTVENNTLIIESKTHLMSGKYRIEINHQPVALVMTHNYQNGFTINIKNERYLLKTGLGNASFQVLRDSDQMLMMQMRQQIDNADKFKLEINDKLGLLTGVGLAIIIMRNNGK